MFRKSLPSFALHFVRTKVEVPLYRFFFSSRRRHTSSLCDWSSDVCSSDLPELAYSWRKVMPTLAAAGPASREIGRASCRERVWISVVAVSLKKKQIAHG